MIKFPHAKINFGLYVIASRQDGYHNIESILWPVPWYDILEIIPAPDKRFSFSQSGNSLDVDGSENLVVKAWELMQKKYDLSPVHIHLHKNIPSGAGLGGGSADAAYTILALSELSGLNLSIKRMQMLAAKLGSDCPFFIDEKPHFVAGKGELLAQTQADLRGYHIGIVKPGLHVSTAEAYKNINAAPSPKRWEFPADNPEEWKYKIRNQFEDYLLVEYPHINTIKGKLYDYGAVYASVTGSGAAVYGLFRESPDMKKWFPKESVWQGQL